MLTLSRLAREGFNRIVLFTSDGEIVIEVKDVDRGKVRIGIEADKKVSIKREELLNRRESTCTLTQTPTAESAS